MLASSGDEAIHQPFFKDFQQANSTLPPYIIMGRDLATFNAGHVVYPKSRFFFAGFI
jgi:hypothetical protein